MTLASGIEIIDSKCFENARIGDILLPESLVQIKEDAFFNFKCPNLTIS